ncbi:MAG: helix-hairpin-helix domain-containing protein [Bacteroidota bacterium]
MRIVRTLQQWLGFTRNELLVILFLSATLCVGAILRLSAPAAAGVTIPQFDYSRSDSEYAALTRAVSALTTESTHHTGGGDRKGGKTLPQKGGVNINTAGPDELIRLPGIGPATAQKIVDYRKQNGRFLTVDDLAKVKGIGPKKLEKLRPYASVK